MTTTHHFLATSELFRYIPGSKKSPMPLFTGCCGGGKARQANAPSSSSSNDTFHPSQTQAQTPAQTPAEQKNGESSKAENAQTNHIPSSHPIKKTCPTTRNTNEESRPAAQPKAEKPSVWKKVSDWLKQFIDTLFIDLEALFTGKKPETSSPCANETQTKSDCHQKQSACSSQATQ